ncbi:MAG: DNA polymerase III subunit delta [Peptococcaceae bacterium]|nr:DNA polymerase III subunit delta [Peptococcaceae bacterium]
MSSFDRLRTDLAGGKIAPVYLFYGKEDFLRDRALALLQKKLLGGVGDPFNLDVLDGEECPPPEILGCIRTPPVAAGWRLVVVRNAPFFRSQEGEKGFDADKLTAYIKKPLPGACLVFLAGETVDRRRVLFKAVDATGLVLEFAAPDARELGRWITERLKREGFQITRGAVDILMVSCGRSLQMIDNELNKAVLYAWEEKRIDEKVLAAVGSRWVEENIFAVVDAVAEKKWSGAMEGIDELMAMREPPQLILTMVARQMRLILLAVEWRRSGGTGQEFGTRNKLHPFVARKVWESSGRFTAVQMESALAGLAGLDAGIKTGRQEFYPGFFDFLLSMAAKRDRPAGGPGKA